MPASGTIAVQIAWGDTWQTESKTWSAVTTDTRAVSIRRGRSSLTSRWEAGTATVVLSNGARQYEPEYASGSNYPNVKPLVPIRVLVNSTAVFTGYVESWDLSYAEGMDAVAVLECVDGFGILAQQELRDYPSEVLKDNPLGYWRLQETSGTTATDAGSGGNNGTYVGSPTLGSTGKLTNSNAVTFSSGSAKRVTIGGVGVATTGVWTVEGFLNTAGISGAAGVWYGAELSTGGGTTVFGAEKSIGIAQRVGFSVYKGVDNVLNVINTTSTAGGWQHVVFSHHGSNAWSAWINGTRHYAAQPAHKSLTTGSTLALTIANDSTGAGVFSWAGPIHDIALYDYTLNDDRVQAHYAQTNSAFALQATSARITQILDMVSWPAADRDITTGDSAANAISTPSSTRALTMLQRTADTEMGNVLIDRTGKVRFDNRTSNTSVTAHSTPQATFVDDGTDYRLLMSPYDLDEVFNRAQVTSTQPADRAFQDDTSIAAYGTRDITRNPVDTSAAQTLEMAQTLVNRFKDPMTKFDDLEIHLERDSAFYTSLPTLDLWYRITVKQTPPGGTGQLDRDFHIERMEWNLVPGGDNVLRLGLSPVKAWAWWKLGDADNGVLGTTTRVAY